MLILNFQPETFLLNKLGQEKLKTWEVVEFSKTAVHSKGKQVHWLDSKTVLGKLGKSLLLMIAFLFHLQNFFGPGVGT